MKRAARLGGLIATSALTLGVVAGPAHAATAKAQPDGDFIVFCFQPALVNLAFTHANQHGVISQPDCSRDTFIDD